MLRQRIIDSVDRDIANALPGQIRTDVINGVEHTSVWWTWRKESDTSAQKGVHSRGNSYKIKVKHKEYDGPWVFVTSRPDLPASVVVWMPGLGFDTAEQFLDWYEEVER